MNQQPDSSRQQPEYIAGKQENGRPALVLTGAWTISNITAIEKAIEAFSRSKAVHVDAAGIGDMDTAGAWLIRRSFPQARIQGLSERHEELFKLISQDSRKKPEAESCRPLFDFFAGIGVSVFETRDFFYALFSFVGMTFIKIFKNIRHPSHFRFPSIVRHTYETGVQALPIICPLAFGISMVVSYQGATQLQKFGADVFTIDLTVVSLLREMAVLTTAILVAGRSGSAFAAEIGVMKMRGEVDALRTMGLDPVEMLVVPRLLALLLTLPMLSFIADMIGLAGGAFMAFEKLDITPVQYITRLHAIATPTLFFIGMIKAPVFALLITAVCTYQGMNATGSAENVGKLTTLAVVQSIFLVIMADALFSVLFSKVGI
jgi:phospholipid/cholesterol/gamma-HCH transport system permease protein